LSRVFADTSALYALLVENDANHPSAASAFNRFAAADAFLVTSSYVLVETYALLTRRIGLAAVAAFRNHLAPLLSIVWVDDELHERGVDWLLERGSRAISLVDAVSFLVIREQQIDDVFAYDRHFADEGFNVL
jgi:uncharacterized protein